MSSLNDVGILQQHNRPQIYHSNISDTLAAKLPDLADAMNGTAITTSAASTIINLTTTNGTTFRAYAKNAKWDQDLAPDLIIPDINADMIWETWMRPYEDPYCPARPAKQCYSATTLSGTMSDGTSFTYKETQDHSKWGVSSETNVPYTCIGDINRMTSQRKRGGGAACLNDTTINKLFLSLITEHDTCDSESTQAGTNTSQFLPLQ